jgi:hypothetical protein
MNMYLYYWTWNLVIILLLYVWFEHPGHTYGGFVPSLSERGMTVSVWLFFVIGECVYWCVANLSTFALGRPLPPPPPPSPTTTVFVVETIEEMQKLLLSWEEELMWREEALVVREEKVKISEKSLTQVSATLDTEWAQAEATQQEYLDKIQAHTDHGKHVPDLNKMLGERKEELGRKERDLELRVAVLVEAPARGLNPLDNRDELMELIERCGLLWDAEISPRIWMWIASPYLTQSLLVLHVGILFETYTILRAWLPSKLSWLEWNEQLLLTDPL